MALLFILMDINNLKSKVVQLFCNMFGCHVLMITDYCSRPTLMVKFYKTIQSFPITMITIIVLILGRKLKVQ